MQKCCRETKIFKDSTQVNQMDNRLKQVSVYTLHFRCNLDNVSSHSLIDFVLKDYLICLSKKEIFLWSIQYRQFQMKMTKKEHVWNFRTSINDTKRIIQYIVLSSYRLKNSCYFSFPFLHKFAPWRDIDFQNVARGQWFKQKFK